MLRVTLRRLSLATLLAISLAPVSARAQCVVEGLTAIDSLGIGHAPAPLVQPMRVTLTGAVATLEGTAPLVFRREVPASQVRLYLAGPFAWAGVLAASRGVSVTVEAGDAHSVTATLRAGDALAARRVSVPCASLATQWGPALNASEGLAAAPRTPWVSRSVLVYETRCTQRNGAVSCAEEVSPRSRCRPRNDASLCGYHPAGATLRVFVEARADAPFIELTANRDVVFVDEDGRRGWFLLRSRGLVRGLAVRGWVRAQDVRWAQEVLLSARRRSVVASRPGRSVRARARRGAVTLAAGTALVDAAGVTFAHVGAAPFCTHAELPPGAARAFVTLPGMGEVDEGAQVDASQVTWVDACPPSP
jgi:hypothetical protein